MPYRMTAFEVGHCYHVYNRGANRAPIFASRDNYLFFLRRVRKHLLSDTLDVIAYCLMPNHYHLLVRLRTEGLSDVMHSFSISYTKAFNKQQERTGHLFAGPFQAIHVDEDDYLIHLSRYIHLNPLMAGMVTRPEDWEFSSYREYVGLRNGTLPRPELVLDLIGSRDAYRRFVEEHAVADGRIAHLLFDDE